MENSLEYSKSINRLIGPFHSYVRITNNWEAFQTNRVLTCSAGGALNVRKIPGKRGPAPNEFFIRVGQKTYGDQAKRLRSLKY